MSTTLKDIVMSADSVAVIEALFRIYPDQVGLIDGYVYTLSFLRDAVPATNSEGMRILIEEECSDTDPDGKYYVVFGRKPTENNGHGYALEFRPWADWLGYDIDSEVLLKYSEAEILAHVLWEMTFVSFNPDVIQAEWDELDKCAKEVEELIESGDTSHFKTLKEVLEELNSDLGED